MAIACYNTSFRDVLPPCPWVLNGKYTIRNKNGVLFEEAIEDNVHGSCAKLNQVSISYPNMVSFPNDITTLVYSGPDEPAPHRPCATNLVHQTQTYWISIRALKGCIDCFHWSKVKRKYSVLMRIVSSYRLIESVTIVNVNVTSMICLFTTCIHLPCGDNLACRITASLGHDLGHGQGNLSSYRSL